MLRIHIKKNSVNHCSLKFSLPLLPSLPPPSSLPFSPVCLRKPTHRKFRLTLSPRAWQRDPGCRSSSAICLPRFHLSLHLSRPLLTPASVLSGRESFQILAESNLVLHCHSTGGRAMGGSAGHQPALLLFQPAGSWRRRSLQGATQRCVPRRLTNSLGSANVHSWVTSLPVPGSSVDFDGVFPQFQELEKLVFRPLLQGHQGPRFLLQILV